MLILSTITNVHPYDEAAKTGIITVLQGMGIVFSVLILLTLITRLISVSYLFFTKKVNRKCMPLQLPDKEAVSLNQNPGPTSGEMIIDGIEDEGTVAVIMAVVAHNTGSDLKHLKFKSIRALED